MITKALSVAAQEVLELRAPKLGVFAIEQDYLLVNLCTGFRGKSSSCFRLAGR